MPEPPDQATVSTTNPARIAQAPARAVGQRPAREADRPRKPAARRPGRDVERKLFAAGHQVVIGMDEVGRGALAGPVSVGAVAVDADTGRLPAGLRDSKLLDPRAREKLRAPIRRWCRGAAIGHASAAEIDAWGIVGAQRLAGQRALEALIEQGLAPTVVILDGHHDWLTPPLPMIPAPPVPQVLVRIKADMSCASVAAASVLAKCERDEAMTALHPQYPQFCWDQNKGYATSEHLSALREHGPCRWHRRSWALPGAAPRAEQGMMEW